MQLKCRLLAIVFLSLLASCSSQKTSVDSSNANSIQEDKSSTDELLSAAQHLALAQTLAGDEAVNELYIATNLFLQEEEYPKALWAADKTLPLIDKETLNYTDKKVKLVLIKSASLQALGYHKESYAQLEQVKAYSTENNLPLTAYYYQLLGNYYQHKQRPIAALNAQLFAFSLTNSQQQTSQDIELLWGHFQRLSQWELKLISQESAPNIDGWIKFTYIANKFSGSPSQLHYHLNMWQKKHPIHPANLIATELLNLNVTTKELEKIAVIAPLTGKQKSAGLAIQQGVLASFANDHNKEIHFIDSNSVNWYGLNNDLASLEVDYVIGPLLKSNVDKYISYTSGQTHKQNQEMLNATSELFALDTTYSEATELNVFSQDSSITAIDSELAIESYLKPTTNPDAVATLFLNAPSKQSLTSNHTILSMRPEEEAYQAASTLSRKNFKHPIVLSQKNVVSKRIAQAFVLQWQRITGNEIEVVYYDTGAQMQKNIKSSLAVDKSKTRINKLKSRLNQSIKTQTRNRQDIDMIYIVGTPEQTRLVKPYIEVNISPFAKNIPLFASSRSHSTQNDNSTNSDLRGLSFTEIPWLLPNEKNAELSQLSQQLWPKRSDSLSRLFAMGYDSYQLINKIPLMQQAPYLQHWGQSGVLKLNDDQVVTRSLLWGKYQRNKVTNLAME